MPSLLQFVADFFESNRPLDPASRAQVAIENIVPEAPAQAAFRHPRANREAHLAGAVVAFEFKRSKRRSIGFSVGPQGLVVSAPHWVTLKQVDAALQDKSRWIIQKLGEAAARHQRHMGHEIEWRDGLVLPYLGQPLTVVLVPCGLKTPRGVAAAVLRVDPASALTLCLSLPPSAPPEHIRHSVQAWLMGQARQNFIERLDHFASLLQVQWRSLSLSHAKTRWGSARTDGAIRLNWRLVHFGQATIDYVVAHELSHLREMNHSPRFWDTVRSVLPDYAALRQQLKDASAPRWG